MSEFYRIGYWGKELLALNIVRHYRNLLHLSDISKCDGVTLDEYIVSDCSEISALHVFPCKEPRPPTTTYGEKQFLGFAWGQAHFQQASVHLSVFRTFTASGSPMRQQTLSTWLVTNLLLHALTPTSGRAGVVPGMAVNMIGCRWRVGYTLAHISLVLPCAEKGWQSCTQWWHSLSPLLS
jgi:hypothetical protein